MRRDSAFRKGVEPFLLDRTFADCLERIDSIKAGFADALLLGCPVEGWPAELRRRGLTVEVLDPGPCFAAAAGGRPFVEDAEPLPQGAYDLCLAIGTLDTVNNLPAALANIRRALRPDGLLIGAMSGGDTLPELRAAMAAADRVAGSAAPRVHPRIEASALAPLLAAAGFAHPVVDIDRVRVSYPSLTRLVADLRAMASTNLLRARSRRPLTRQALAAARRRFAAAASAGSTAEQFEILHFAAWASPARG